MRIINIFTLIFLFITISCGKKEEVTKLDFRSTLASTASDFPGGLVFYGKDDRGRSFSRIITSGELVENVPNGTWKFYLFGWDGIGDGVGGFYKLAGGVSCAFSGDINLNGGTREINFSIGNSECDNTVFGKSHYGAGEYFFNSKVSFLPRSMGALGELPGCLNGTVAECSGAVPTDYTGDSTFSIRFRIKPFNRRADGTLDLLDGAEVITKCFDFTSGTSNEFTNKYLNFPMGGDGSYPFEIAMELYDAASCSGTKHTRLLRHGLLTIQPGILVSEDLGVGVFEDFVDFYYRF